MCAISLVVLKKFWYYFRPNTMGTSRLGHRHRISRWYSIQARQIYGYRLESAHLLILLAVSCNNFISNCFSKRFSCAKCASRHSNCSISYLKNIWKQWECFFDVEIWKLFRFAYSFYSSDALDIYAYNFNCFISLIHAINFFFMNIFSNSFHR